MQNRGMPVPEQILEDILDTQYFAVLSTFENKQPYNNLVAFAATGDHKALLFVTSRNTRKYRNIMENERVALLVDSRTNQPDDVNSAFAITAIGSAREELNRDSNLHSVFLAKHADLRRFVNNPANALIVVTVSEYFIAGFEKTQRIVIGP